jgi:hypothetical protein
MISYWEPHDPGAVPRGASPFLTVHGWQSESGVKHLMAKRLVTHAICWGI